MGADTCHSLGYARHPAGYDNRVDYIRGYVRARFHGSEDSAAGRRRSVERDLALFTIHGPQIQIYVRQHKS